jgi:MFS family permease
MGIATGLIIHQTGRYLELIYAGLTLLTIGEGVLTLLDAHSSFAKILGFEILLGLGVGMLFEPPLIALQANVRQDEVATATGTMGFVRNLATSLGVVVGGVIFQNGMDKHSKSLATAGLPPNLISAFSGRDAEANVVLVGTVQDAAQRLAVKESYAGSLKFVWVFYTCTGACALISSIFIVKHALSTEHTETKTGLKKEKENVTTVPTETSIELQQIPGTQS